MALLQVKGIWDRDWPFTRFQTSGKFSESLLWASHTWHITKRRIQNLRGVERKIVCAPITVWPPKPSKNALWNPRVPMAPKMDRLDGAPRTPPPHEMGQNPRALQTCSVVETPAMKSGRTPPLQNPWKPIQTWKCFHSVHPVHENWISAVQDRCPLHPARTALGNTQTPRLVTESALSPSNLTTPRARKEIVTLEPSLEWEAQLKQPLVANTSCRDRTWTSTKKTTLTTWN